MHSENHNVNELCLIVINDGNGDQCGMTYAQRCDVAEFGLIEYRNACRQAAEWLTKHEAPKPARQDIFEAADIIKAYYQNHMKEVQA